MQNLTNIEKSAFKKGQYIGYANGIWHIKKCGQFWLATHVKCLYMSICENTLENVSKQLAKIS